MIRFLSLLLLVAVAMLFQRPGLAVGATNDADSPDPLAARIESLRLDGRYAEAADLAEERLEELRAAGADDATLGEAANELGLLLWKAGRPREAEERAREGLSLRTRSFGENGLETAASAHTLGMIVGSRGRFNEAEELLRRALAIRRAALGDASLEVADTLINLGLVLREAGRYDEAAVLLQEELVLRRELLGEEHRDVAASLRNLAILFFYQGDWAEAEPLFRRAAAIQRTTLGDSHPELAGTLEDLGRLLRYQGDYADAEAALRESWEIRRDQLGDEHPLTAKTLHTIALCLGDQGNAAEAERLNRQTLATLRRTVGDEHPDLPGVVIALALLLWDSGEYAEAEALFREAATTSEQLFGPTHRSTMFAQMSVAGVVYDRGRLDEAEELARDSLKEWRATFGDASGAVAHAMTLLGRIQLARGNAAAAESTLERAASVYEAARLRSGYGFERATFIRSPYRDLAAARLALGKETEAWEATERDLARVLADLVISSRARPLTATEAARSDSLDQVLGAMEEEVATLMPAAAEPAASARIRERCDEVRRELAAARIAWSDFQRGIAAKYPFAEGQIVGLGQAQALLPGNVAIVGWLDVEGEGGTSDSWGWVVRADRLTWMALGTEGDGGAGRALRDDIAAAATRRFRARVTPRLTDAARAVWDARVGALGAALSDAEELVVVPSGPMLGVPVEALIDEGGEYVGDRFSVSYAPSATIWAWLRGADAEGDEPASRGTESTAARPPPAKALLVGAPQLSEGDGLRELPWARTELERIAPLFPSPTVLAGADASEPELVALASAGALRDFAHLHFATHAFPDDRRPEDSALVLSRVNLPDPVQAVLAGERIDDGLVTAGDILRTWKLDADLVTLSACESGLGRDVGGEGTIGFAQAFFRAGARTVMVSLWAVNDEATSLLMTRFYENRLGGERGPMSKAEALREAKLWLRDTTDEQGRHPFEHPFYWAGFVLLGEAG